MIAVIFEAWPHEEQYQRYLELAAELKPLLAELDGFISVTLKIASRHVSLGSDR